MSLVRRGAQQRPLRLRLRCCRAIVQPNGDTAKTAQQATASLDAVTFPSTEDGFHDSGQLAQKNRPSHRWQFARVRNLLKKLPKFLAGEVSVGVGREIFLDETRNRTAWWCGIARTSLAVRQEAAQGFDGVADQVDFRLSHAH